MSLNPDIAAYLELVAAGRSNGQNQAMHHLSPAQARQAFDQASALMGMGGGDDCVVEAVSLPGRAGNTIAARRYLPQALVGRSATAALVYLHGGGYVVGSLDSHDAICQGLAERADCQVFSIDYRLAPDSRFPAAVEDAEDAWCAIFDQAQQWGIDVRRMAVAGDSVGGSLATVLANTLADERTPCLQVLVYPVADASRWHPSVQRFAQGFLLEQQTLEWFYGLYGRNPQDRFDPRFSPLLASLRAGLAPALIVLADHDPLYDEGMAYAAALREAGVAVDLHVYAGMTHDFLRMDALVDEADEALELIAQALREAFA